MQPPLLPLFPLGVVLFPRTPLPLHIFEDRYKEMIGEAIANQTEFGIVLAGEKGIVNTGCTAIVEKVVHRYPDGRLDILASGRRRFEILLLNDEASYIRGAVEFFDDDEETAGLPADTRQQLLTLVEQLQELELTEDLEIDFEDPQVTFQIAQAVPDLSVRQVILATRTERGRAEHLLEYLPAYLKKQRAIARARTIAPRNGHLPGSHNQA